MDLERFSALLRDRLFKVLGDELVSIVIFGSLARGEAKFPGSDVDLLVVTNSPIRGFKGKLAEIAEAIDNTFKELKITPTPDVDLHTLTRSAVEKHPPIMLDMTHHSIIVYDRGGVVRKELGKLKERLKELGAQRITLPDGSWYWVLKPGLKLGEAIEL